MSLSTHVLDLARGVPARGVPLRVEALVDGAWTLLGEHLTDEDGRVRGLVTERATTYRLVFALTAYLGDDAFFPEAVLTFRVTNPSEHHHVPLLLSPFGFSTYRGS